MAYAGESLNRLERSLEATGVLSKDYRNLVMCWALEAYAEGFRAGQAAGREEGRKDFAEQVRENVCAAIGGAEPS